VAIKHTPSQPGLSKATFTSTACAFFDKEQQMKRKASAEWKGGLKDGKGTISTDSGVLSTAQYSFSTRFEEGKGTNPEELIAAAHAGCFSMALSGQLGNAGMTADSIRTTAAVTLEKTDAGFTVTSVHLDVTAKVPGADKAKFDTAANNAKAGCPISRLLNAKITMDAKLES
jgi:osmotically inducible protein OsmC